MADARDRGDRAGRRVLRPRAERCSRARWWGERAGIRRPLTILRGGLRPLPSRHLGDSKLLPLADGALASGRRTTGATSASLYSPEVVGELSAEERAERLATDPGALTGLRALAARRGREGPIDARGHSKHVATLAGDIARGCSAGRRNEVIAHLREAALVHDVGKIGMPDAILLKPGSLDAGGVRGSSRITPRSGREIAVEILAREQVAWIRWPLTSASTGSATRTGSWARRSPSALRILALADAWDVMTITTPVLTSR